MLKKLNDFSNFDYNWNKLNMLNSSLSENETHFLAKFQGLKKIFSNVADRKFKFSDIFIASFLVTPDSAVNDIMVVKPI
jgi:hypothetical protein